MTTRTFFLAAAIGVLAATGVRANECANNPNALGTSRVMAIDPQALPRVGTVQYGNSLPLQDKEVVLTFDDGPMPPYTNRVLEVLAEQCVKANYFIIGRMAQGYPDLLRQIRAAGHVIGTHSQNHPLAFERMPLPAVRAEIEQGIASVGAALGDRHAVAPFFRIPGLLRAPQVEGYLQSRGLMTWSADVVADDWKHISAAEVVRRAIARLDEKGKGILLLHDIQPATSLGLPELLRQLKARGYRIVQVVPGKGPLPVAQREAPATAAVVAMTQPPAPPNAIEARAQEVVEETPAAGALAPEREPSAEPPPQPPSAVDPGTAAAETVDAPGALTAQPAHAAETAAAAPANDARAAQASARAPEAVPAARPPAVRAAPVVQAEPDPDIPREPVRPFANGLKPSRNVATPGKRISLEPGGWPPSVQVPMMRAGGIGVSAIVRSGDRSDGRFQASR